MEKVCTRCGMYLEENTRFCSRCGCSDLRPMTETEQAAFQTQQNQPAPPTYGGIPVNNQPVMNGQPMLNGQPMMNGQPMGQKPKKKLTWWQILLIVFGSIWALWLVLCIIIGVIFGVMAAKGELDTDQNIDSGMMDTLPDDFYTQYSPGMISGDVYVNEWANLRFSVEGWEDAAEEYYQQYETEPSTDVGYLSVNPAAGEQLLLYFENVGYDASEDLYLDQFLLGMQSSLDELQVGYEVSEHFDVQIGTEDYRAVKVLIPETGVTQMIYARALDDYMICFSVSARDEGKINDFVQSISSVR